MMLLFGALFLATPALLGRRDRILRSRNNFFKNKEAYTRLRGVARMLEMQDTTCGLLQPDLQPNLVVDLVVETPNSVVESL